MSYKLKDSLSLVANEGQRGNSMAPSAYYAVQSHGSGVIGKA